MSKKIIVALDFPTLEKAARMSELLGDSFDYKVGMELCTAAGVPEVLDHVGASETFLDLKFHDIPNTVEGASAAASRHGVKMFNVHCLGGKEMMHAAVKGREKVFVETKGHRSLVLGVTVLTSHSEASVKAALKAIGVDATLSIEKIVAQLAILAYGSGLDGVVCSPHEIKVVREAVVDKDFLIVTPGIRSKNALPDDQSRTLTVGEALELGANHLVIGRPITGVENPLEAAEGFLAEAG
jgi:orotidine-5'-phosphate decarboxylase